jgi:hypothetical protein
MHRSRGERSVLPSAAVGGACSQEPVATGCVCERMGCRRADLRSARRLLRRENVTEWTRGKARLESLADHRCGGGVFTASRCTLPLDLWAVAERGDVRMPAVRRASQVLSSSFLSTVAYSPVG